MFPIFCLSSLFFTFIATSNAAESDQNDSSDPVARAKLAIPGLQTWYNDTTGLWESTGWWNGANIVTIFGDYAKAFPSDATQQEMSRSIFSIAFKDAPVKNPTPGAEKLQTSTANTQNTGSEQGFIGNTASAGVPPIGDRYFKYLDPNTFEPHSVLPPSWNKESTNVARANTKRATGNANDWLDGFYDDDLWWALAWINAYDVTQQTEYLNLAEGIFLAVAKTWGTNCSNGGIYWSIQKDYVNAIANELFFSTAAHLANRASSKQQYVDWANKSLNWFLASGMLNSNGNINDGLTNKCENNGQTVWSYNQGVILGGLVELGRADPASNTNHITQANMIAKAAITKLADSNGVIHDACEPNCGADGAQFKGIFMRNLAQLNAVAPDPAYVKAFSTNAQSVWANDRKVQGGSSFFSVHWAGPFVDPVNAAMQSSAMEALLGAAVTK